MDEVATQTTGLRRVGVNEALQHMAGAAVVFASIASPFARWTAAGIMLGTALGWAMTYCGLRRLRLRFWFGAWDALSFGFVWSYALVLALTIERFLVRWS